MKKLRNFYLKAAGKGKKNFPERLFFVLLRFLSLLTFVYLKIEAGKRRFTLQYEAKGKKVISVGNITWGGTGKTPFVMALAEVLLGRGRKPLVILRGYPHNFRSPRKVGEREEAVSFFGEEAVLIRKSLPSVPVWVGKNREEVISQAAMKENFDTVILDDGFQYRKLKRDMDILLIDGTDPFGNGHLIPAGSLREPVSQISRADAVIVTRREQLTPEKESELLGITRRHTQAPVFFARHIPANIDGFRSEGRKFAAFCGIGNPSNFFTMLEREGMILRKKVVFPDHHFYKKEDLNLDPEFLWLTTEKDFVKITFPAGIRIEPVKMELRMEPQEWKTILEKL